MVAGQIIREMIIYGINVCWLQVELVPRLDENQAAQEVHDVLVLTRPGFEPCHHCLVITVADHPSSAPAAAPRCGRHDNGQELFHRDVEVPGGGPPLDLEQGPL